MHTSDGLVVAPSSLLHGLTAETLWICPSHIIFAIGTCARSSLEPKEKFMLLEE